MAYYVYADYPTKQAKVHKGVCPNCNHGKGQKRLGHKPKTADWFGPYESAEAGFQRARQTGLRNVLGCRQCNPDPIS